MNTQFIDFEGNFGSQDPALQPTAEDFAAFSAFFQARRAENEQLITEFRQATQQRAVASKNKQLQEVGQTV